MGVIADAINAGGKTRTFDTGATRDTEDGKLDYEGFLSPAVLKRYAEYMHANRLQSDGTLRDSDNWQKGIPMTAYMKSMWRHFHEVWTAHRAVRTLHGDKMLEAALCALLFNVMGYLHELLKHNEKVSGCAQQGNVAGLLNNLSGSPYNQQPGATIPFRGL